MWKNWQKGILPVPGGWLVQPLELIVKIGAFGLVLEAYRYKNKEKADWKNFSELEAEIIRWLKYG